MGMIGVVHRGGTGQRARSIRRRNSVVSEAGALERGGNMRIVCAIALFSASVLSMNGCGTDTSNAHIVFQSTRDGNFEIYSMNADGSEPRRLTNSPKNDLSPSWSPDGSTIVFASDRDDNWEIYSMNADGSNQKRLTGGVGANTAPSWAMRGKKILFVSTRDAANGNLYLMNPDGSSPEQLTSDSLVKDSPIMAPDGRTIVMTVNTKGRYRIASFRTTDKSWHFLTSADYNSVHPSLSADGSTILCATDRDGNYEIYSMDIAGLNQTRLTTNSAPDLFPVWTSLHNEILFSRSGSVYRLQMTTGAEQLLSFKGDTAPQWQGDE
jgi:Tol biopolymer transport system component